MKKTLKALLLCLFLCIGILSLPITALAEEGDGEKKEIVQKVELYKNGDPLEAGDEVSLNDEFYLKYTLNSSLYLNMIPEGDDRADYDDSYILEGDKIILPKFPTILAEYPPNIDIEIPDPDDPSKMLKLGYVTLDSKGNALLDITTTRIGLFNDVVFGLDCSLNAAEIGSQEDVSFTLYGSEDPITIKIKDNQPNSNPDPDEPEEIPLEKKLTLKKDYIDITNDKDNDEGIITWKITLDNLGYAFNDLTVYDKFNAKDSGMKFIADSVEVSKNGSDISDDVTVKKSSGDSSLGKAYDFAVVLGNADANDDYVISYKTKIEKYSDYLKINHKEAPDNEAWFEYNENDEVKTSKSEKIGAKFGLKPGIEKNGKYDPSNHEIKWKITANSGLQHLTNVRITEFINSDQEFVSIQDAKLSDGSSFDIENNYTQIADKEYLITLGDILDGKSITFTVVTKLANTEENHEFWSGNNSKKYYNKIVMNSAQIDYVEEEVSTTCKSNVLTKEILGDYNYETHEFEYQIVANDNKMDMTQIIVKDGLNENGLELSDKPVTLNGEPINKDTGVRPYYTYNSTDGTLIIYPEDAVAGTDNSRKVIKFFAKVKDQTYLDNINSPKLTIKNNASLETKEHPEPIKISSDKASKSFNNSMFSKTGKVSSNKTKGEYTIVINSSKQVLPDGCTVKDTLGSSFELDDDSIKLYVGIINPASGEVTAGEEATGYTTKISDAGDGKTLMEVKLPDNSDRTIYVLKYTAPALYPNNNDFSNHASLEGFGNGGNFDREFQLKKGSFQFFSVGNVVTLIIDKTDKEDGTPLEGAVFSISDEDGNEVLQLKTRANGQVKAINKLQSGKKYIVKEIKAPDGYDLSEETKTITVTNGENKISFTNTKTKAPEPDVPNPGNNGGNTDDNKNGNGQGNGSGGPSNGSDNKNSGGSSDSKHHDSDDHHDNDNNGGNNNSANNAVNTNAGADAAGKNAANANANAGNKPKIIVKAPSEYDDRIISDEEIKANGYTVVDGATLEGGDPNYEYILGPNGEVLGVRRKVAAGAKLAKTGGFVGTLVAYIIGGVAVIIGTVLLVINPKKAHNRKRR